MQYGGYLRSMHLSAFHSDNDSNKNNSLLHVLEPPQSIVCSIHEYGRLVLTPNGKEMGAKIKQGRLTVSGNLKTRTESQSAVDEMYGALNKVLKKKCLTKKERLVNNPHLWYLLFILTSCIVT